MTGVVRKATFLAVLLLAVTACVSMAGVPDPAHCSIPTYVRLAGCNLAGAIDPSPNVSFSCTIRDIGNLPVANQIVAVQFSSDVRIYNYAFPGFVSCQCVEGTTDINGVATFHIPGSGRNSGGAAAFPGTSAATWYAWNCGSTTVLGTSHVATFDENGGVPGTRGVEITDLSAWIADFALNAVPPVKRRSDFNTSGTVEITDLSIWIGVFSTTLSSKSCGTLCTTP
jgi:hypothetical protein